MLTPIGSFLSIVQVKSILMQRTDNLIETIEAALMEVLISMRTKITDHPNTRWGMGQAEFSVTYNKTFNGAFGDCQRGLFQRRKQFDPTHGVLR